MNGIPDAAVVHETVLLARKLGFERATGFTNAVLRGLARKRDERGLVWPDPETDPVGNIETWGSLPRWLAERLVAELGPAEALAFAEREREGSAAHGARHCARRSRARRARARWRADASTRTRA